MNNNVKNSIIMIVILLWGNISGIGYLINNNSIVMQKAQQSTPIEPTILGTAWTIIVAISSSLSHGICYIMGIEIRSFEINYYHVFYMAVQLLIYYLLAYIIITMWTNKSKRMKNVSILKNK